MNKSKPLTIAALLIVLLFGALKDAYLLSRNHTAVGVDGYYYVIQVNALKTHHRLYFRTPTPLVLYFLTGISYVENDAVKAVKIGSVFLHTLLTLGIFALIASATRNLWLGVLGTALAVVPQAHLYLTTEFINQLGALALLVWAAWLTLLAKKFHSESILRWTAITGSIGLLVAALFSHRLAMMIAILVPVCGLLIIALSRTALWKGIGFLAIVLLWLSPAIMSVQTVIEAPAWVQRQVSSRPHWPFGGPLLAADLMLMIASITVLLLVIRSSRKGRITVPNFVFGSIALWSVVITLNPFLNPAIGLSGVGVRLRVMSYIQVAFLVPALIWLISSFRREAVVYVGAVFLPFLVLSALAPAPYGLQPTYLGPRQRLIDSLKIHSNDLPQNAIVIAPHGDQFVVTATIGVPSQQRPPNDGQYREVYWLLYNVNDLDLIDGSIVLFKDYSAATTFSPDSIFRKRWSEMTALHKDRLRNLNPHVETSFSP